MPLRRERGKLDASELLRVLVVVLGWIGFVWMWVLVGRQPWDSNHLVWLIVGALIIVPLLTLAWVAHNRAIFRRKGERRGVTVADASYRSDWNGRTVDADWPQLQRSRLVTIDLDGRHKVYRSRDGELAPDFPSHPAGDAGGRPQDDPDAGKPASAH